MLVPESLGSSLQAPRSNLPLPVIHAEAEKPGVGCDNEGKAEEAMTPGEDH